MEIFIQVNTRFYKTSYYYYYYYSEIFSVAIYTTIETEREGNKKGIIHQNNPFFIVYNMLLFFRWYCWRSCCGDT